MAMKRCSEPIGALFPPRPSPASKPRRAYAEDDSGFGVQEATLTPCQRRSGTKGQRASGVVPVIPCRMVWNIPGHLNMARLPSSSLFVCS